MKKGIYLLLICLIAALVLPAAAETRHVYDMAGTFSEEEIAGLESKAEDIYRRHGTDVMIVTTDRSQGKVPMRYAADFYESVRDYTSFDSYVIFAFCFDVGEYGEAAYGRARNILSAQGDEALYRVLSPYLPSRRYGKAMNAYLAYVDSALTRNETPAQSTGSSSSYASAYEDEDEVSRFFQSGGWIVIFAFIAALITVQVFKAQMKIAKSRPSASRYVSPNSLRLHTSSDLFLYETTSRVRIESSVSSSSSSGGRSFTSSSGRSYGGRGGKL